MEMKQDNIEIRSGDSNIPERIWTEEDILEIDRNREYDNYEYESEEEYARGEGFWVDDDGNWIPIDDEDDDFLYDDDEDDDDIDDYMYEEDDDDSWLTEGRRT